MYYFLIKNGRSSGYEGAPVLFYTTCACGLIGCGRRNFALDGFKCENISLFKESRKFVRVYARFMNDIIPNSLC